MCFTASDHEEYMFDWEPIMKSCWCIIVGHRFLNLQWMFENGNDMLQTLFKVCPSLSYKPMYDT